jgi:hypothetical protein
MIPYPVKREKKEWPLILGEADAIDIGLGRDGMGDTKSIYNVHISRED